MAQGKPHLPTGGVTRRKLHFFWLADYSASMSGDRIASLNNAIRDVLPEIRDVVKDQPQCDMQMRAISFSTGAEWHVGPAPKSIESFIWQDLSVLGATATAEAIQLLCDELEDEKMTGRQFPPVCVLISDGYTTSSVKDYDKAIARLNGLYWGRKAVRLAIGIGKDGDYSEAELLKFVNTPEIGVLKAHSPGELIHHIRFVSVSATRACSQSKTVGDGTTSSIEQPTIYHPADDEAFF